MIVGRAAEENSACRGFNSRPDNHTPLSLILVPGAEHGLQKVMMEGLAPNHCRGKTGWAPKPHHFTFVAGL